MNDTSDNVFSTPDPRPPAPCPTRRIVIRAAAGGCLGAGLDLMGLQAAWAAQPADQRPALGDRLVALDAMDDGAMTPLRAVDIQAGAKPRLAFPYDAGAKVARDGSRLNKVLLVRLDTASMDDATRARSADGVLAFSAVCTHQGCDVSEWVEAEKVLLCFCHFSRFDPARNAQVTAGPAPRALPALPLRLEAGQLVVNGTFSAAPGVKA